MYIVCGRIPLWAQLRTAEHAAAWGAVEAVQKVVAAIRKRIPGVRIILRADAGFANDELMAWCESQEEVYYCIGLQQNPRLLEQLRPAMAEARARQILCGGAATRQFVEFEYRTLQSWSRTRRVIGKAEVTALGDNPRFVVTNLPAGGWEEDEDRTRFEPRRLYPEMYCGRGRMENMLKEQLLDLKADRVSTHHMESNQLRLWLSTMAYLLLERIRAVGLAGSELADATVGSIRLRLLKVAAQVTVSVRRVHVRLSRSWPRRELFAGCARRMAQPELWSG